MWNYFSGFNILIFLISFILQEILEILANLHRERNTSIKNFCSLHLFYYRKQSQIKNTCVYDVWGVRYCERRLQLI